MSGGYETVVQLWNVHSKQCVREFQGHTNTVHAVAFHPEGHLLASGARDLVVRLWDVETGACQATLSGHTAWIKAVAFSSDGTTLASSAEDGTIRMWDIATLECRHILVPPRPYEGMNITGATGLTNAQCETLKALGAVEES